MDKYLVEYSMPIHEAENIRLCLDEVKQQIIDNSNEKMKRTGHSRSPYTRKINELKKSKTSLLGLLNNAPPEPMTLEESADQLVNHIDGIIKSEKAAIDRFNNELNENGITHCIKWKGYISSAVKAEWFIRELEYRKEGLIENPELFYQIFMTFYEVTKRSILEAYDLDKQPEVWIYEKKIKEIRKYSGDIWLLRQRAQGFHDRVVSWNLLSKEEDNE